MGTRSRDEFKKAFLNLLDTTPADRISVSAIIKESGFSRSSFYRNYLDYFDFTDQLIKEEATALAGMLNELMLDYTDSNTLSRSRIKKILEHVFEEKKLYHMIFASKNIFPEYNSASFSSYVMDAFRSNSSFHFKTPDADPGLDEDFYRYSETLRFVRYLMYWDTKDYSLNIEYLADQIVSLDGTGRSPDYLVVG